MRSLSIPAKKLVLAIPACMAPGLTFGAIFPVAWLKSLIPPLTFLMVYPMMVGLRAGEVFKAGDARLQAVTQIVNFLLATLTGKLLFKRGDAIALVYGSVMRNLSIALAISLNAFGTQGSTAALVIALAYVVQMQAAAWYVRFTPAIFGEEQREAVQTA